MKRKAFLRLRERYARQGRRFVDVDESGFAASAYRTHGYAPRGQRLYGAISAHTRPRTSLLAARGKNGLMATWLFEGTCNATLFNHWLETELANTLTANDVVVMDNATFHKTEHTRRIIKATGATLLYLPPYSPDLNPIEHDFATIKKIRQFNHEQSLDDIIRAYQ
ncbi:MAG: IS630 family transposase [Candidatus Competibacteraceae bacterium]